VFIFQNFKAMPDSIIELQSVSKTYPYDDKIITALDQVSIAIERKDIYGIIGLSGAGKSTLIRCLARLVTPSSGTILFHRIDCARLNKDELRNFRKKTGMIFQHFNLLSSRTAAGNIAYPLEIADVSKEEREKRIDELLGLVGLKEKKNAYPSWLSGGEKQRVGIARALANHPEILFCDEATSSLDPKTTKEILNLLKKIHRELNLTIVLITHEMEVIKQICNKVAVLEHGKIVEEGPVTEVFSEPKHLTTKQFLQKSSHEIPPEFFKEISPSHKLLRLTFKGKVAGEPIISELVRRFNVDANILLGWIDRLQSLTLGTLIIEMTGTPEGIKNALDFLQEKQVHFEVIEHAL
jgi:D-methionine transport system ATP-binding protein